MTHDLLDDELRAELRRLASVRRAPMVENPVALVERRVQARRDVRRVRRRVRTGVLLAAALGVASLVVAMLVTRGPDSSSRVRVATAPPASETPASGVQVLDRGPLSPRINAAVAWTGAQLFVWGGNAPDFDLGRQLTDGATYDPKTRQWSLLAGSPFPPSYDIPVAVATSDEVVVAQGRVTVAWHYETSTWTRLEDAPAPVTDLVWAGGPLLSASANASLDPRTGKWTRLTSRPAGLEDPRAVWTGTELVALGQGGSGAPPVAAYSPDGGQWRIATAPPNLVGNAVAAAYDGRDVVVVDFELHAAAYDPTLDRWRALPDVPARFFEWYPRLQVSSSTVTAFMGNAVAIRGDDGEWTPVSYSALGMKAGSTPHGAPGAASDSSGGSLLVFGTGPDGGNVLVRLWPDRVRATVRAVPVGPATVRLGDGFRFVRGDVARTRAGAADGVLVVINTPSGRCGVGATAGSRPIRGSTGSWARSGWAGWRRELAGQDVLTIKCSSPAAADVILDRIDVRDR